MEFKWDIPAGLELVNGSASGTISLLQAGLPTEVQLTLRTTTGQNHQVHFVAGAADKGVGFSDTAQFNTLAQPVIDASKQARAKSTEEAAATAQQKPKGLKVFH